MHSFEAPKIYVLNTAQQTTSESQVPMAPDLSLTEHSFVGGLNTNWVYTLQTQQGEDKYILRIPNSVEHRLQTVQSIQKEYKAIGATDLGVKFNLRSITEQAYFIDLLNSYGFNTLKYVEFSSESMLTPFVEGTPLHEYVGSVMNKDKFIVIQNVLTHLSSVHSQSITIGDRWCPNTLVQTNNQFLEIDYDIQLTGDHVVTSTFELSQLIYHLIHFANQNRYQLISYLGEFLTQNSHLLLSYNMGILFQLLVGHADFFTSLGEKYAGIDPPYDEVYELIRLIQS